MFFGAILLLVCFFLRNIAFHKTKIAFRKTKRIK